MCGIVSVFSNEKKYDLKVERLIRSLLWIDTIRGFHSTGVIYPSEEGVEHYKKAMAGWDFIQLDHVDNILQKVPLMPYFIGHNRAATKGSVSSKNAHPFQFGDITGVHNGTLTSYTNLTPQNVTHQVDSQYLFDAFNRDGAQEVIPKLRGAFNLLWVDESTNTVHMCRNEDRPYTFAKIKDLDILVGASEKAMLKWLIGKHGLAIEYCWTPKEGVEYVWDVEKDMVKTSREAKHELYTPPPTPEINKASNFGHTAKTKDMPWGHAKDEEDVIEFWLDEISPHQHLMNRRKVSTLSGYTVNGERVKMFNVPDGDMLLETWYTGRAKWRSSQKVTEYYAITNSTVKLHPISHVEDAVIYCTMCATETTDENTIYVDDSSPCCLPCAQQLGVEMAQLEPEDMFKLLKAQNPIKFYQ